MSTPPADRKYTESHEWHMAEGDLVVIGITQHAVDQLTDVTFVELKPAGTELGEGDAFGEVESVKTTSDVYTAVAGPIAEINQEAIDNPSILNEDPYGKGWLVKVKAAGAGLDGLMDAAAYAETL